MTATNEDQSGERSESLTDYWYECSFTYDGELYTFTSDVDVVAEDSIETTDMLFYLADEELPEDYNGELLSGVTCKLVREGDVE
jgi:hypothetical protein